MIPDSHLRVLRHVVNRLHGSPVAWVVTGSLGIALQGVPVAVHDMDIQTDERGAYEIERRLAEFVVQPVRYKESERIRSHLGALEIDGVKVELMGDVQKLLADGSWEESGSIERHRRWVELDEMRVGVLALEYEYEAYLRLGRRDKVELLGEWLRRKGGGAQ